MDNCWKDMYKKDKYARDRVMKSVRMILPYLKDGDTVLDVGCFTQEAKKYLPWSVDYIGIDQQHPLTRLRHGDRQIHNDGGLAFLRLPRRNQDAL